MRVFCGFLVVLAACAVGEVPEPDEVKVYVEPDPAMTETQLDAIMDGVSVWSEGFGYDVRPLGETGTDGMTIRARFVSGDVLDINGQAVWDADGTPAILVGDWIELWADGPMRMRRTAAHEFGHHLFAYDHIEDGAGPAIMTSPSTSVTATDADRLFTCEKAGRGCR